MLMLSKQNQAKWQPKDKRVTHAEKGWFYFGKSALEIVKRGRELIAREQHFSRDIGPRLC